MSHAVDLWDEYQALKADGALPVLRGHAYERWLAQAVREGNDPTRLWKGHIPAEARLIPWTPACGCNLCVGRRRAA